jgi:hypothetical protein
VTMVGPRELESLTSAVSRRRSNQLSYGPVKRCLNWAVTDNELTQLCEPHSQLLPCQGSALTN